MASDPSVSPQEARKGRGEYPALVDQLETMAILYASLLLALLLIFYFGRFTEMIA